MIEPLPSGSRWKTAAFVSLGAHALVIVMLTLSVGRLASRRPVALNTAMAVELLPMPAAPASPPHDTPDRPKPKPVPPSPVEEKMPPVPDVRNPLADVTLPSKPPPPPPPPKQAVAPASAPQAAAAAAAPAAPVKGSPITGSSSVEQNYDARILARLEKQKRYPYQAMQQRLEDVIYLHLVVSRNGEIVESAIVRSKGVTILDAAVRDLVKRVNPMPAMPKELTGDTYAITVPIDFYINRK